MPRIFTDIFCVHPCLPVGRAGRCEISESKARQGNAGRLLGDYYENLKLNLIIMKIKKLNLQTAFLKTLQEFYSSVLELPVEPRDEEKIKIKIGESELIFTEAKTGEPFYHYAINIPANKIEEAKKWLSNKVKLLWMDDYKNDIADFVNWHARSVYFYDPAGNIVELIARFDLDNSVNETFTSSQFLSLNEVGLVFTDENFEKKITNLEQSYSLSYFDKQPPLPKFRAMGDDHGLFVIVPEHRNWYPTDKPSGMFPMVIEFENGGSSYSLVIP